MKKIIAELASKMQIKNVQLEGQIEKIVKGDEITFFVSNKGWVWNKVTWF